MKQDMIRTILLSAALMLAGAPMMACGSGDDDENNSANNGQTDTGGGDAGTEDSGEDDTGTSDTGTSDTGPSDTGTEDTGEEDTGPDPCGEDERVEAGSCVACAAGTTNDAGDNPSGDDTQCEAVLCDENEQVDTNSCVACAGDLVSEAGADASGPDTQCYDDDACFAELGVDCDAFQEAYVKADELNDNDFFGSSVALDASGETLVVAADSAEVGDVSDTSVAQGVVYVFVRNGSTWTQQAALEAPDAPASEYFGFPVDIDGDTIAVGQLRDDGSGSVFIFERTGTDWGQPTKLKASNADQEDGFGSALALDGDTLVVGAPFEASADPLGGDGADNDLPGAGAAYVFERSGGTWIQTEYLKPSNLDEQDGFGVAVAIDGDTVVVTSRGEDSNATGVGGDATNNDEQDSAAVYVFTRSAGTWSQQAYLKQSNTGSFDGFGGTLSLAGDTLAVAAATEPSLSTGVGGDQDNDKMCGSFPCRIGAVYVFVRSGSEWSQQAYIKATNAREDSSNFGRGLALTADGDLLAVGAQTEDGGTTGLNGDQSDMSSDNSGATYLYERDSSGAWSASAYIKAFHDTENQRFGIAVALDADGTRMAVGASLENGTSPGINGDTTQQDGEFTGATYVYRLAP
jgi:hypothetical protein